MKRYTFIWYEGGMSEDDFSRCSETFEANSKAEAYELALHEAGGPGTIGGNSLQLWSEEEIAEVPLAGAAQ